jgi:hypothetical protein
MVSFQQPEGQFSCSKINIGAAAGVRWWDAVAGDGAGLGAGGSELVSICFRKMRHWLFAREDRRLRAGFGTGERMAP